MKTMADRSNPFQATNSNPTELSWLRIILLYVYGLFAVAATGKIVPVLGLLSGEFHIPRPAIGWLISANVIVAALAAALGGTIARRAGLTRTLVAGLTIFAAVNLATSFTASLAWFVAWRVLEGFGYLAVVVTVPVLLMSRTSGRRQLASVVLWSTLFPVGFACGLFLGAVGASFGSWHLVYTLSAGISLLLLLAAPLVAAESTAVRPAQPGELPQSLGASLVRTARICRERDVGRLALVLVAVAAGTMGIITFAPGYLARAHDVAIARVAGIIAFASAVQVAGHFAAGVAIARSNSTRWIGAAAAALYVAAAAGALSTGLSLLTACVLFYVWAFSAGVVYALVFTTLPRIASPQTLPTANGLLYQAGAVGTLLGPPIMFGVAGRASATGLVAVLALVGVAIFMLPAYRGSEGPMLVK